MSEIDPAASPYPQPSDRVQPANRAASTADSEKSHLWEDKEISFGDVLDAINPLQHIPVIATIYRHLTGDDIGNVARVIGDGIYGGPIGVVAGLAAVAVKEETGKDPGEHVLALVTGDDAAPETAPAGTAVAADDNAEGPLTPIPVASASLPAPSGTAADGVAAADERASHAPVRLASAAHARRAAPVAADPAPAAATAVPATASAAPVTAQASASPPSLPSTTSAPAAAPAGPHPGAGGPVRTASSTGTGGDAVASFQAEKSAFMGGFNRTNAARPVLNNHPIPLQGFALATVGTGAHHPMVNLAALPPTTAAPGSAHSSPATPANLLPQQDTTVTPPPSITPGMSTSLPAPGFGLPGGALTAPIDVRQQMMDALDKYARLQQERAGSRGKGMDETR